MILKEKQNKNVTDPKLKAGQEAEKQMAFYLQRAFKEIDDCYVFNDLRVIHKDNAAQIDHLVVTQYGLFIVESKSVYGKITVNANKEWSRTYNKVPSGMASPVLQAEEQGNVLRALLRENAEQMLDKLLGLQKGFKECPIIVFVAISDSGIIERKIDIPELMKADQVTEVINSKIKYFKKNSSLLSAFSSSEPVWSISAKETVKVANFLLYQNRPLIHEQPISAEKVTPNQVIMAEPKTLKENDECPKCKTGKLVKRKAKTEFLGCSLYPKCKFTDYK